LEPNHKAHVLASILKEHPTLKSLCGNKGDEIELDMSGRRMGASGAIMLAAEIVDNRVLSSLDLSDNILSHGLSWRTPMLGGHYEIDTTGKTRSLAANVDVSFLSSEVHLL
jgi:hypothetical protein